MALAGEIEGERRQTGMKMRACREEEITNPRKSREGPFLPRLCAGWLSWLAAAQGAVIERGQKAAKGEESAPPLEAPMARPD